MKKTLFAALIAVLTFGATVAPCKNIKAQSFIKVPTTGTRTITAADTMRIGNPTPVPSKVQSIQITLLKVSGTVAGKAILEGTDDTLSWIGLDSLTLVDQSSNVQSKWYVPTKTSYAYYRWRVTNTSSATLTTRATLLRRYDE